LAVNQYGLILNLGKAEGENIFVQVSKAGDRIEPANDPETPVPPAFLETLRQYNQPRSEVRKETASLKLQAAGEVRKEAARRKPQASGRRLKPEAWSLELAARLTPAEKRALGKVFANGNPKTRYPVSLQAVVRTARETSERLVSTQWDAEVTSALVKILTRTINEREAREAENQIPEEEMRQAFEESLAEWKMLVDSGALGVSGKGNVVVHASGLMGELTGAAIPFLLKSVSTNRRGEPEMKVTIVEKQAVLKLSLFGRKSPLNETERAEVSRFVEIKTGIALNTVLSRKAREAARLNESVAVSLNPEDGREIDKALQASLIRLVNHFQEEWENAGTARERADLGRAFAFALMKLADVSSKIKAEKLKETDIALLLREYFSSIPGAIIGADGSIRFTLQDISSYLNGLITTARATDMSA
jgi:hypothetical protein